MKQLDAAFESEHCLLNIRAREFRDVIHAALELLVQRELLSPEALPAVEQALLERESRVSTVIGHSVAIPHAYLDSVPDKHLVIVRTHHGLNLGAPDGIPTRFFFVLVGPPGSAGDHIDTLTGIARLMSDDEFRHEARTARTLKRFVEAYQHFLDRNAPTEVREPPQVPESLRWTAKPFGGIVNDLKRRLPHYASDWKDGIHPKCLASTLFLFFACLAPTITFGGIMAANTEGWMGPVEMILAAAICGCIYAVFSGQPLVILGGTGPLLIFETTLYQLCIRFELPYLETRLWVGIWSALMIVLLAAAGASSLLRYFTRFTDEIFAALICLIYITSAVAALLDYFETHDLHGPNGQAEAVLVLLLASGTLYVASSLARARKSRYLFAWMREFLSDFGPAIAMGSMILLALYFPDLDLDRLTLPEGKGLRPTADRSWLLDPTSLPVSTVAVAAIPAILFTVLIFVDQQITVRLVNSPDHHLQKGEAYHYDFALIGLLVAVCSFVGLPWFVAATVRSLNHVRSLATVEEVVGRDGVEREKIIHVRENRVTPLAIHLLIGCSLFLVSYLKFIPMPVLYGLFLYMGIASIAGNQFFERLSLWFTDSKLYPVTHYTRSVPTRVIHAFTAIQLSGLILLGAIKQSPLGILFPLVVAMMVPLRIFIRRFFRRDYLAALDGEEHPGAEATDWAK